jgi:hypothetical protein
LLGQDGCATVEGVDDATSFAETWNAMDSVGFSGHPAQLNPNLSQLNPNLLQLNPNLSQLNPNLSQLNPNLSQLNPNLSQLNPNVLPGDEKLFTLQLLSAILFLGNVCFEVDPVDDQVTGCRNLSK